MLLLCAFSTKISHFSSLSLSAPSFTKYSKKNQIYQNYDLKSKSSFGIKNLILKISQSTSMGNSQSHEQIEYCYPMPNSKEPGFTPVFRNPEFKDQLTTTPDPNVKTYRDVVVQSFSKKFVNNKAAGKIITKKTTQDGKEVEENSIDSLTYKECFDRAELLGKAMLGMKLEFTESTQGMRFVGIYAKNRMEWLLTDLACTLFGITTVPLYDTLGVQNLSYCLNQTELTTLFMSADTLKVFVGLKDFGRVKNVVLYDRVDNQTVSKLNQMGIRALDFNTLVEQGKKFPNINFSDIKVSPSDIYTFSYTSGTTGPPKGAMISHLNITSFLSAFNNIDLRFVQQDVYLSFLPLPHVFERLVFACLFFCGAYLVFYRGDILKLKDDCQIVKPTIFCAVPRLYNRIIEKVEEGFQAKSGLAKCLINSGLKSKSDNLQENGDLKHSFYDSLVFQKIKEMFGGRIRQMISASAPLSKKNFELMQIIMSAPLYEAYGQTQNTGAAFCKIGKDPMAGHVGGVVTNLEFRLADIPEMKYTSEDKDEQGRPSPRGQIWLRGPAVIPGYYKLKDKTDEAITKDGWLQTGDVGVIMAEGGRLRIIDRKKNIFKLQQGEYVAPEKVENIYARCPYVEEVFLHGDSAQNFCVTVVKPRQDNFLELAKRNNLSGSYQELCQNPAMRKFMIKEVFEFGKKAGLNTFEQAKNIYLESSPFMDKKILTNTMKLQRYEAKTVYKQVIEKLYQEGELPVK